jgi:hypothetical protein
VLATPPCLVSQLQIRVQNPRLGLFYDGESGERAGWIVVRNRGAACELPLRPRVTVAVRQRTTTIAGERHPVRVLSHGASAVAAAVWGNWCAKSLPAHARFTLPGGSVELPIGLRPRCDAPRAPTVVAVGTFQRSLP